MSNDAKGAFNAPHWSKFPNRPKIEQQFFLR